MMYQGLYGAFPFTVSDQEVCTFRDFKTSREMVYAEHKTLDGLPRIQHTGRNLDPVSLTVLVAPLGERSTVNLRLRALDLLARLGKEMPLVIGFKYHGLYTVAGSRGAYEARVLEVSAEINAVSVTTPEPGVVRLLTKSSFRKWGLFFFKVLCY